MNEDFIEILINFSFKNFFEYKMIPKNLLLIEFYKNFKNQIKISISISIDNKNGIDFKNEIIQNKILLLKNINNNFLNFNSFKKISLTYFINNVNTIISYCSLYSSFLNIFKKDFKYFEKIAEKTKKLILIFFNINNFFLNFENFKLLNFNLNEIFQKFNEELKNNSKIIKNKLENFYFNSHVCSICNENPSICYCLPCQHSYLCFDCLKLINDSKNLKCFICNKLIDEIIYFNYNHFQK